MKNLFKVLLLFFLFSENSRCNDDYYEGLGALYFYTSLGYYKHFIDSDEGKKIASNIIMEAFTYFVNCEKNLITPSTNVEKAIFRTWSNFNGSHQDLVSDPYWRQDNVGFVINPAVVRDDADYHKLVKKFEIFLEKGRKELEKVKD